jgi:TMEM175 potassium channel family protein
MPARENIVTSETARIEAFSDGVFAIAATLLILEIKIPSPGAGELSLQLIRQWPSYVSFVISFAFIGIMWINHHRLFTHIRRSDNMLLVLNLLLLLGVTAVPFPTAVLAAHLGQPDQRTALMLYNGTYLFIAIFFNVLWRYAVSRNRHLLGGDVSVKTVDHITRQYALGPVLYLVCFVLAWVSVPASLFLNVALAGFFALPPRVVRLKQTEVASELRHL